MFEGNYIHIAPYEHKKAIFRFTKIKWLIDDFVQNKNTLLSPRKWDDPFENALAREIRLKRPNGSVLPHPFQNRVYGQCWTLTPETDAFWRMYAPEGDGVRLRSTIGTLYRSLERSRISHTTSCFIGRMQYKPEAVIKKLFNNKTWVKTHFLGQGTHGHVETLLIKRTEFTPENEVRLLFLDPHNVDCGDFFMYDYNPSTVITEITFDPRMAESLCSTYKAVLHNAGFTGEINQSTLYRAPKIMISI